MRRAMAEAEVGDDDYGEDPTVRALEEAFAERVGKPAALFVPSGTMANQIAFRVLATAGTAVVAGRRQHVVAYEYGAAARNSAVQFHAVDDADGMLNADDVRWAGRRRRTTSPRCRSSASRTRHMAASGAPWSMDQLGRRGRGRRRRAHPPRRRPALQRRGGHRRGRLGLGRAGHDGDVLPVQGALRPGGLAAGRARRRDRRAAWSASAWAAACARRACSPRPASWRSRRWSSACPRTTPGRARLAEAVAQRWPDCGLDPASVRTNIVTFSHAEPDKLLAHLRGDGVLAGTVAPAPCAWSPITTWTIAGVDRAVRALERRARD